MSINKLIPLDIEDKIRIEAGVIEDLQHRSVSATKLNKKKKKKKKKS